MPSDCLLDDREVVKLHWIWLLRSPGMRMSSAWGGFCLSSWHQAPLVAHVWCRQWDPLGLPEGCLAECRGASASPGCPEPRQGREAAARCLAGQPHRHLCLAAGGFQLSLFPQELLLPQNILTLTGPDVRWIPGLVCVVRQPNSNFRILLVTENLC